MITSNDRLFSLLFSVGESISINRLNCYTYILQKLGMTLDYSFRVNVSGLRSKGFARYLEEQVSTGLVTQKEGMILPTSESDSIYGDFILTFADIVSLKAITSKLTNISDEELYLVCVVDMFMEDVIKVKGINGLIEYRSFIEKSVENLCSSYSNENFNSAVALLNKLKKECTLNG